jgi:hypothetical protein
MNLALYLRGEEHVILSKKREWRRARRNTSATHGGKRQVFEDSP